MGTKKAVTVFVALLTLLLFLVASVMFSGVAPTAISIPIFVTIDGMPAPESKIESLRFSYTTDSPDSVSPKELDLVSASKRPDLNCYVASATYSVRYFFSLPVSISPNYKSVYLRAVLSDGRSEEIFHPVTLPKDEHQSINLEFPSDPSS